MDLKREGSAYRAFRTSAYRHKYETALFFGGKSFTYEQLLSRVEQAYNTFRQMGVEPMERISLWLPNCPDLLCIFYALSRLGAVGVLAHPDASPKELMKQMEEMGAERLITTSQNYEAFCDFCGPLGAGKISLCRPWRDLKGKALRLYLQKKPPSERFSEMDFLDQQMEKNRYHAGDAAYLDEQQPAVILFSGSSFLQRKPVVYLPTELSEICQEFYADYQAVKSIYIQHSFAYEGGFLGAHAALCSAKTVLWGQENRVDLLKRQQPDLILGTDELFWEIRQWAEAFCGRWKNLQGGIQMGKEISPLMKKYAPYAFEKMGGRGAFSGCPVGLKTSEEPLFFIGDFGVRLEDVEAVALRFNEVEKCRCIPHQGGFILQITAKEEGALQLANTLLGQLRWELGTLHLPRKIEIIKN